MFFIYDKYNSVGCNLPYKCKKEREHVWKGDLVNYW